MGKLRMIFLLPRVFLPTCRFHRELCAIKLARCLAAWHFSLYKSRPSPVPFLLLILVQGHTRVSEDSSETVFLLVENYNYLTAPVGLRIGWEFLENNL